MKINSETKLICLLGLPTKQSFSPNIHNYLFEKYNENKSYVCFDVLSSDLKRGIEGIKALNILGSNVTIPHKVDVIEHLDEVSDTAKLIGAVNTIKNEDGILKGYNTDGEGFVKSILDKGYDLTNKNIMVLGAGGSSRSICIELAKKNVKSINIKNRSIENANKIATIIKDNFNSSVICSVDEVSEEDLLSIDILINTTPIGMESSDCPIDKSLKANENLLVCDIVYKPHNTELLKWAKDNNLETVHGIDMLVNQAIKAFEIWTNKEVKLEDIKYIKDMFYKR